MVTVTKKGAPPPKSRGRTKKGSGRSAQPKGETSSPTRPQSRSRSSRPRRGSSVSPQKTSVSRASQPARRPASAWANGKQAFCRGLRWVGRQLVNACFCCCRRVSTTCKDLGTTSGEDEVAPGVHDEPLPDQPIQEEIYPSDSEEVILPELSSESEDISSQPVSTYAVAGFWVG